MIKILLISSFASKATFSKLLNSFENDVPSDFEKFLKNNSGALQKLNTPDANVESQKTMEDYLNFVRGMMETHCHC